VTDRSVAILRTGACIPSCRCEGCRQPVRNQRPHNGFDGGQGVRVLILPSQCLVARLILERPSSLRLCFYWCPNNSQRQRKAVGILSLPAALERGSLNCFNSLAQLSLSLRCLYPLLPPISMRGFTSISPVRGTPLSEPATLLAVGALTRRHAEAPA
jgi:hypothetical protein